MDSVLSAVFCQQCEGLACQFFDQQFVAAGCCGGDDFLVDAVPVAAGGWDITGLPVAGERGDGPLWEGRDETGADGRAYVCRDHTCRAPVDSVEDLLAELDR